MDYKVLEEAIKNGCSTHDISKQTGMSQTNVRYWLKKYGLTTLQTKKKTDPQKYSCQYCNETDIKKMMKNGKSGYSRNTCKNCHNKNTIQRGKNNKNKALEYKGSKCQICSYDLCIDALEFHHRDPNDKDPHFKKMKWWSWEKITKELDKCDLLCCRCHREIHAKLNKQKWGDSSI